MEEIIRILKANQDRHDVINEFIERHRSGESTAKYIIFLDEKTEVEVKVEVSKLEEAMNLIKLAI